MLTSRLSKLDVPSDTGLSSTTLQSAPPSGACSHTTVSPSSSVLSSSAYVHARSPVWLCPVRRSKSYLCRRRRQGRISTRPRPPPTCHKRTLGSHAVGGSKWRGGAPVPGTDRDDAGLALLDLGVAQVRAEVRARRLHRVQLVLRRSLCRLGVIVGGEGGVERGGEPEEDELVVCFCPGAQGDEEPGVRGEARERGDPARGGSTTAREARMTESRSILHIIHARGLGVVRADVDEAGEGGVAYQWRRRGGNGVDRAGKHAIRRPTPPSRNSLVLLAIIRNACFKAPGIGPITAWHCSSSDHPPRCSARKTDDACTTLTTMTTPAAGYPADKALRADNISLSSSTDLESIGAQIKKEEGNQIKYRTCSWQKVRRARPCCGGINDARVLDGCSALLRVHLSRHSLLPVVRLTTHHTTFTER